MDLYSVVVLLVLCLAAVASGLVLLLCSPLHPPLDPAQNKAPSSYVGVAAPISRETRKV